MASDRDGTRRAARMYEDALKYGYIDYRSVVCILTGIAGSGKTSFKHLLCNIPPPKIRQSTPFAEAPIKAMSCTRLDATTEEFKVEDDDQYDKDIAGRIAFMFSQPTSRSQISESAEYPRHSNLDSPSSDSLSYSINLPEACSFGDLTTNGAQAAARSHRKHSGVTAGVTKDMSIIYTDLIATFSQHEDPRRVHRVYLVDSGGQPQYQDLSSLFLSPAAITIFVTNLADTLDSHPMIGYYENGRPLSKPQPSPLSHLEVLQHTVQSIQSQVHARRQAASLAPDSHVVNKIDSPLPVQGAGADSSIPNHEAAQSDEQSSTCEATTSGPVILVVGTHRDQEKLVRLETRAKKNQTLLSLLRPVFGDKLVYYSGNEEVIFPINARTPHRKDRKVISKITEAMLKVVSSLKPERIPMKWDILERALQDMATKRGRPFLTREECLKLARNYHMSERELDAALDHLSRLNRIFYFREALPGIIFVRTQAFLDKLSELVYRRYELDSTSERMKSITGVWINFRDKGLVKLEILNEFPKHYITEGNLFTPRDLVKVLLYRSVIAEVGVDEYFMPFILSSVSQNDLEKHRLLPTSNAAPLVITFSGGAVPSGLFPALVAFLLSSRAPYPLDLYPNPSSAPECVYRNCIKFRLPSGTPGSLTLIDSFTHIEVHMDAPESVCMRLCPTIKKTILGHLKEACCSLKFHRLSPQVSVLCESKVAHGELSRRPIWHRIPLVGRQVGEFRHYAEVSLDTNTWACILAPGTVYGELELRHHFWFPTERPSDVGPSIHEFQCLKWNKTGRQERTRIMDEVTSTWRELGSALGFSPVELDAIEQDCLRQPLECIQHLFGEWSLSKPTYSWTGLLKALGNSGHSNLATRVKNALTNRSW